MDKSKGLLTNANWSIFSIIVSVLGAFVSMPIIINTLGINNYGLFSIILMIGGFAAIQDFGLGEATLRYVSLYYSKNDIKGINRVVNSTLYLYIIILGSIFIIIQLFSSQIINLFELDNDQVDTGILALRIAAFSFVFVTIAESLQKIPQALLRYDVTSKVNLLIVIIRFSSMIIVVKLGYGIIGLMCVIVLISILKLITYYIVSKKMIKELKILPHYDKNGLKEVFSFSIYSFLNSIISQIANYADRLVLGMFYGASDVAFLAAPKDITSRASGLVGAAGNVLFPKFSSMKEGVGMQKLYVNVLWGLTTFSLIILIPLSVVFSNFLTLWISEEFSNNSSEFAKLFALGFAFNGGASVYMSLLKGTGRMKLLTSIISILTITSIVATIILVYNYGLIGSGIRTLIFSWVCILICIVIGKNVFNNIKLTPFVLENAIIPLIVGFSVYFLGICFDDVIVINNWLLLIVYYTFLSFTVLILSFILNYLFFKKAGSGYYYFNLLSKKIWC